MLHSCPQERALHSVFFSVRVRLTHHLTQMGAARPLHVADLVFRFAAVVLSEKGVEEND